MALVVRHCATAGVFMLCALAGLVEGGVLLSTLPRTLVVEAEIEDQVPQTGIARASDDHLRISWALNTTRAQASPGLDALYERVNVKLCYAPVSQVDRGWRKKNDDLHKDKTCGKGIVKQKYTSAGNSTLWRISKDVPGAVYFVRTYVLNANGTQVAFGQTTNSARTTNLIEIVPISGRHATIDVAAAVFSAFSIGSLLSFLGLEHMRSKRGSNSSTTS